MLLAAWVLAGCGRQAAAPARPPSAPLSRALMAALDAGTTDAGARDAALAKKPPELALEVSPMSTPAPNPMPSVKIQRPRADERLTPERAANFPIELSVEHWPAQDVELVLDGFRARRLSTLETPARVGSLVPADGLLAPGEHVLVAIAVRPDGRTVKPSGTASPKPYAVARFSIGPPTSRAIDLTEPRILYSEPRGTYNGARAAGGAFIDFYLLNAAVGPGHASVECHVTHAGAQATFTLNTWQAFALHGLENGDYTIALDLRGPDGKPPPGSSARVERTITVNRDAPTRLPPPFRGKKKRPAS
jgi:hypothetical protein